MIKVREWIAELSLKILEELASGPKNTKELADKLSPLFRSRTGDALSHLRNTKKIEQIGVVRVEGGLKPNPGHKPNRASVWKLVDDAPG